MELRVLRYFLTVAREENITRASEILHITQPTLSRQLAQMEEELGVTLLHRGTRRISLTNEGFLLRRRAEEILDLVDKAEQELILQEEQIEGRVTLGCGELASMRVIAEICGAFRQRYPRVHFELYTGTADIVKERMDRGIVDVGLLLEPIDMEKYDFMRLKIHENWVALMRPDDPLASKEAVSAEDLKARPLILPSRLNVQGELANWFGDAFGQLEIAFTGNLSTNSAVMVAGGLGCALVIGGAVPFWDAEKIASRPLTPPLSASTVLAWKRQQPFSAAAEKYIEFAKCFLNMDQAKNIGIGHQYGTVL